MKIVVHGRTALVKHLVGSAQCPFLKNIHSPWKRFPRPHPGESPNSLDPSGSTAFNSIEMMQLIQTTWSKFSSCSPRWSADCFQSGFALSRTDWRGRCGLVVYSFWIADKMTFRKVSESSKATENGSKDTIGVSSSSVLSLVNSDGLECCKLSGEWSDTVSFEDLVGLRGCQICTLLQSWTVVRRRSHWIENTVRWAINSGFPWRAFSLTSAGP